MKPLTKNKEPDLLFWWRRFVWFPWLGKKLFSLFLGIILPYSALLKFTVVELQPGYALVEIGERWRLRSYSGYIHRAALASLLELTSTLSIFTRGSLSLSSYIKTITINYHDQGEGSLLAECVSADPQVGSFQNTVVIMDSNGKLIASGKGFWDIYPE